MRTMESVIEELESLGFVDRMVLEMDPGPLTYIKVSSTLNESTQLKFYWIGCPTYHYYKLRFKEDKFYYFVPSVNYQASTWIEIPDGVPIPSMLVLYK